MSTGLVHEFLFNWGGRSWVGSINGSCELSAAVVLTISEVGTVSILGAGLQVALAVGIASGVCGWDCLWHDN